MGKIKDNIYKFKKVNGKWEHKLNEKLAFKMYTEQGLPIEEYMGYIDSLSFNEKFMLLLVEWKEFAKKNKIDLDEIRQRNLQNKDQIILRYDKLLYDGN